MANATSERVYFLGIDVGTGGTRAVLVNEAGQVTASRSVAHAPFISSSPGWAEQDPADWWRATQQCIRDVLNATGCSGKTIAAIGLAGQMHGAVLLDANGNVLRPSLIWCDTRSASQCERLHALLGRERVIEWTCNPALPNFTLTKILWVREHEPDIFARTAHILCPKDYVRFCLSGTYAMDVQEASGTLLLDIAQRQWSGEMAEACEIPLHWLPDLFESPEVCATVSAQTAAATGLWAGTPIVAGAGDQGAGAIGMGILEPGSVSATIGTSGVVFAATADPIRDPLGRLHTFCHAVPGRWHVMGVTQAAGLSLRWLRDVLSGASTTSYESMVALAEQVPAGSDGLLWAPYLFGERTPYLDPEVRAAFTGLDARHTSAHLVRAVLEGVAYSLRDSFALLAELGVPVRKVRLGGGGARSELWRQIQTDVYGHAAEFLAAEEGAAFGAALLAAVGAGAWRTLDEACNDCIRIAGRIEPNPTSRAAYDRGYKNFRKLYPALSSLKMGS